MAGFDILRVIIFVALMINQREECDAARILGLFPLQGKSHYMMCETLMRALAARGHQVDVVSHFPLKNPPANYRDISLAGTIPSVVNNLTYDEAQTFTAGSMKKLMDIGGKAVCNLMNTPQIRNIIENPPKDPPYDLVINELFVSDCYLAFGRHLKVPIVGIMTSKLFDWSSHPLGNPASTAFVPSIFSGFSQRMNFFERLQNTFLNAIIRAQHAYYISSQLAIVEKQFGIQLSNMYELYNDIAVMLINTHPSFDFIRPLTPRIVEVGGLHVTDGHDDLSPEVKKWLDESKQGCIYFSFGSMIKIESFPIETIKAFYRAFEIVSPIRVLIKIPKKDELPPGLPKNVMTSPWLPQTRVLQHKNVKAFVTHGGLMSTQEAIHYGVPMIDVPIFGDQYLNARLCEQRKMAITVNYREINAESFAKNLQEIIKNPIYGKNAKRISKLWTDRPMKAIDTAVFWIEHVIRNGNILRSPADELYWWEVELLDVYSFIIFVIILVLFISYKSIKFVCSRLCQKSCKRKESLHSQAAVKSKKNK